MSSADASEAPAATAPQPDVSDALLAAQAAALERYRMVQGVLDQAVAACLELGVELPASSSASKRPAHHPSSKDRKLRFARSVRQRGGPTPHTDTDIEAWTAYG